MSETIDTDKENRTGRFDRKKAGHLAMAGGTDINGVEKHPLADFVPDPVRTAEVEKAMEEEWAAMEPHDRVTELGLDEDHSATIMLRHRILMPELPPKDQQ